MCLLLCEELEKFLEFGSRDIMAEQEHVAVGRSDIPAEQEGIVHGQNEDVRCCSSCKDSLGLLYSCTLCDTSNLCARCHQNDCFLSKMNKLVLDIKDGSLSSELSDENQDGLLQKMKSLMMDLNDKLLPSKQNPEGLSSSAESIACGDKQGSLCNVEEKAENSNDAPSSMASGQSEISTYILEELIQCLEGVTSDVIQETSEPSTQNEETMKIQYSPYHRRDTASCDGSKCVQLQPLLAILKSCRENKLSSCFECSIGQHVHFKYCKKFIGHSTPGQEYSVSVQNASHKHEHIYCDDPRCKKETLMMKHAFKACKHSRNFSCDECLKTFVEEKSNGSQMQKYEHSKKKFTSQKSKTDLCDYPRFSRLKALLQHFKNCNRSDRICINCQNLINEVRSYSRHCKETKCSVPFCLNIKNKLKQQQLLQRLQQSQLLRRSMAVMNTHSTVPFGALPGNSSTGGPDGVLAGGAVGQVGVMSGQPGAGNMVQEEAARQQAPHTGYAGKVALVGVIGGQPQVMQPSQVQQLPIGPTGPSNAHLISTLEQWRYVQTATLQNPGLRQTTPQTIQQPQQPSQPPHLQPTQPNILPIPPINICQHSTTSGVNMARSAQKAALQQLLQILKSPNTPEKQQQILQILKRNPQLMAAFIKQRQIYEQQQLAQQQGQAAGEQQQQPQQPSQSPHLQPTQPNILPITPISICPPPTSGVNMARSAQKAALQKLLQVLKSPNTPEQQQQILQILKSNPQLMAAFIKQRQIYQQQQQAQQQGQAAGEHQQQQQQHMMSPHQQQQGRIQTLNQQQVIINQQQGSVLPQQGQQQMIQHHQNQQQWYKQ